MAIIRLAGEVDDTAAINRFLAAGGGTLTGGPYLISGPLVYGSGVRLDCRSKIVFQHGWPSGHAFTSAAIMRHEKLTRDVILDFREGGEIVIPGPHVPAAPRKGIAMRKVDGFQIYGPRVTGNGGLFALEIIDSRNGLVKGGMLGCLPADVKQQGADGIHHSGNVEDVEYVGVETFSGDDAASFTVEDKLRAGSVQRRVTFRHCTLRARGHSALKMLLTNTSGSPIIEDILLKGCRHIIEAFDQSGAPFSLRNLVPGGRIGAVLIDGGSLEVRRSFTSAAPMEPVIQAQSIGNLRFRNFDVVSHFSRQLIVARRCTGTEPIWDNSCRAEPNPTVAGWFNQSKWIDVS